MGMYLVLVPIPPAKLAELKTQPAELTNFFHEAIQAGDHRRAIDLDKSWQALHFLLTGDPFQGAEPHCMPVFGAFEHGEKLIDKFGTTPLNSMDPSQVATAAEVLASISVDELKQRFKPAELEAAQIYPTGLWNDIEFDYLAEYYGLLQSFYASIAESGDSVLVAVL